MEQHETYLGGVTGGVLHKRGNRAGYEIHATNQRVFGVRTPRKIVTNLRALATEEMYDVHRIDPSEKNHSFIQELESTKDFAVPRDDIIELVIAKPGLTSKGYLADLFPAGSLTIETKSGDSIKIRFAGASAYRLIVGLMDKFDSAKVKIN